VLIALRTQSFNIPVLWTRFMMREGISGLKSFFFGSRKMMGFSIWSSMIMILLVSWIWAGPASDRTVACATLICGASTVLFWNSKKTIARIWNPSWSPRKSFVLIGGLCAVWVETVFWVLEKLLGAQGVAASPHLGMDLLITLPWYLLMSHLFFSTQIKYRYSYTEILLLGGLYELGADGIFGQMLSGITVEGLLQIVFIFPLFVMVYSTIVLPPSYILRPQITSLHASHLDKGHRILGGLRPLGGLIPYVTLALVIIALTG